jgi:hypothetical protein
MAIVEQRSSARLHTGERCDSTTHACNMDKKSGRRPEGLSLQLLNISVEIVPANLVSAEQPPTPAHDGGNSLLLPNELQR